MVLLSLPRETCHIEYALKMFSSNLTKLPSCSAKHAKVCTLSDLKFTALEPAHHHLDPTSSQILNYNRSLSIYSIYS